jgi:ApaG protein
VSVEPEFLEDQSRPDEGHYVWAYHVTIENQGTETVTLMSRYWRIVDAAGRVHEVRGAGVVGERPVLRPGDRFEYTSGTPLRTPSGIMVGTYEMLNQQGGSFEIAIPAFPLDYPSAERSVH